MPINYLPGKNTVSFFNLLLVFSFIYTLAPSSGIYAQGNLLVAPKRAVFEARERYKEITLSNIGKDTARYEISFKHYRMKENGSLEELSSPDPGTKFADSFVRFFPRTVTLAAGESQVVRLQLTKTGRMMEGEYRSHLYFRSVPKPKPLGEAETEKEETGAISIKLNAVFGIAIPVIIHAGDLSSKVGVSDCSIEKADVPVVKLKINRTGNMSCYGDLTIDHISPSGTISRVAEQKGIALYTPLEERQVKLPLKKSPDLDYTKGKLHIVYKAHENLSQNSIGQTELLLN
jgi:hypothetical protein